MNNSQDKYSPIKDYGVVGNLETIALISKEGSIDWLCLPDFDSPSVFASILDKEDGGFFQIKPMEKFFSQQKYIEKTNILETTFITETGKIVKITDFMLPKTDHSCKHCMLFRKLEVIKGTLPLNFSFHPKFNYARSEPDYKFIEQGMIAATDKNNTLILNSDIQMHHTDNKIVKKLIVKEGQTHWFSLYYKPEYDKLINVTDASPIDDASDELENTKKFWEDWSSKLEYEGVFKQEVLRSALLLKLLMYNPTGALISSPTTSLPENILGKRNWDYRYVWLKDTAFAFHALLNIGYKDEAFKLFSWLENICMQYGKNLRPVVGLRGEADLIEHNLEHLSGYKDSFPVRIGNDAHLKFELDSFCMVLRCALSAIENGFKPNKQMTDLLIDYTNILSEAWDNPDYSIWEVRDLKRRFTFSKAAALLGIEAGIKIAQSLRPDNPNISRWEDVKQEIHNKVIEEDWSPEKDRFKSYNSSLTADASLLLLPILGFLPIDDHRLKSTVVRIRKELSTDSLVYRYKHEEYDDGIEGGEGAYTSGSFWMAHSFALLGENETAKYIIKHILEYSNPLHLFSEEINPDTKENLGNYPHTLTHISFINAALSIKS
ncbi:MAG: hypothetical protein ACD_20C00050G0006 [uncultured bacterium]|nr:MAG: hypothetical protein ACD_20C00050G0006 [uncultured bacterium]HBH19236.1 hypothetical protein [Cyanobacteria bacterium UBA9579]